MSLQIIESSRYRVVDKFLLISGYLGINVVLFIKDGVKIVADSERYIEYATRLHDGFYFDPHNFWYIGYSLYIALIQQLHGDVMGVVIGQYALGLLAVVALYHASLYIWNNRWSAWCTTLFYLLFIEIASWNAYVLTESIYLSFTCFSLYFLARVTREPSWAVGSITFIVVLFTIFIKPTGIALAGALSWVLLAYYLQRLNNRIIRVAVVLISVSTFIYLVNQRLATYLIMENYQSGEVIYGVTTVKDRAGVSIFLLDVPENSYHPSAHLPPIVKMVLFFLHHPVYWLKLFFTKAYYLLFHIRPFWSVGHNVFSLIVLIPAYFYCIRVFLKERSKNQVVTFAIVYLAIHVLSVCMTSEDWDGRFLMPMLPVVFFFSGHGISVYFKERDERRQEVNGIAK